MSKVLQEIQKVVKAPGTVTVQKNGDLLIKSKDRNGTAIEVIKVLKKLKIKHVEVMKKSKSSSIPVTSLTDLKIDIIYKPIIAKGAGGVSFEKELETDLKNYLQGASQDQLRHADVLKELVKVTGLKPNTSTRVWEVVSMGSQNQKRTAEFNGSKIVIQNNTGATLTDITLALKGKTDKMYLSLKMSASYYLMNVAVGKYFGDKVMGPKICEYFGFDGIQMGGFGKQFVHKTKRTPHSTVKKSMEEFISTAMGTELVLIHKKAPGQIHVKEYKKGQTASVKVLELNEDSYVYPIAGQRKYANIKVLVSIDGKLYTAHFQFRGTTAADVGPKYLRLLMQPD
jgi:hypothetical protein